MPNKNAPKNRCVSNKAFVRPTTHIRSTDSWSQMAGWKIPNKNPETGNVSTQRLLMATRNPARQPTVWDGAKTLTNKWDITDMLPMNWCRISSIKSRKYIDSAMFFFAGGGGILSEIWSLCSFHFCCSLLFGVFWLVGGFHSHANVLHLCIGSNKHQNFH